MGLNPHIKILWERYCESFTVKMSKTVARAGRAEKRRVEKVIMEQFACLASQLLRKRKNKRAKEGHRGAMPSFRAGYLIGRRDQVSQACGANR
jgi:hypothetical protein